MSRLSALHWQLYSSDLCSVVNEYSAAAERLEARNNPSARRRAQGTGDVAIPEVIQPYVSAGNGECIPQLWSYEILKAMEIPFIAAFGVVFIVWLVKCYYLYRTQTKNVIWRVSGHLCILLLSTLCRFITDTVFGFYLILALVAVYGKSGTRCSACFMNGGTSGGSACVPSYSPLQLVDIRDPETWVLLAIILMQILLAVWWQYYLCKSPRLPLTPRAALANIDGPEHDYDPREKSGMRGPVSLTVLQASQGRREKRRGKMTKEEMMKETDGILGATDPTVTPREEQVPAYRRLRDRHGNDLPFSLALVRHKLSGPAAMGKYSTVNLETATLASQTFAQQASQLRSGLQAAPGAAYRAQAAAHLPNHAWSSTAAERVAQPLGTSVGGGTFPGIGGPRLHAAADVGLDTYEGMVIPLTKQQGASGPGDADQKTGANFTSRGVLLSVAPPDVSHMVHDSPVKSRVLEYEATKKGASNNVRGDEDGKAEDGKVPVDMDDSIPHFSVQSSLSRSARKKKGKRKRVADKLGVTIAGPTKPIHPDSSEATQRRHVWLRHDDGEPPLLPPEVRQVLAQKARFAHSVVGPEVMGTGFGGDADWSGANNELRSVLGRQPLAKPNLYAAKREQEKKEAEKYGLRSVDSGSSEGDDSVQYIMKDPHGAPIVHEAPPVPGGENEDIPHPHYAWELAAARRVRLESNQGNRCCRSLRVKRSLCCCCCPCAMIVSLSMFLYPVIVGAFVFFRHHGLMRVEDPTALAGTVLSVFMWAAIALLGTGTAAWMLAIVAGVYYWWGTQP